jgi:hypothetical protein
MHCALCLCIRRRDVTTPVGGSVRMTLTLPKMGLGSPLGLLKTQNSIAGVKTPRLKMFFITMEKVLKRRCRKWPCMSHSDICSTSYVRKKGWESNCQFDSWPLKVGNWPDAGVFRQRVTHHWKALKESYKFASDLIPIGGLSKELRVAKVLGVQTGTISRQFRDSFGTPAWESQEKVPLGCRCGGVTQRILYGGRWWLPPSPSRGESSESKVARGLS